MFVEYKGTKNGNNPYYEIELPVDEKKKLKRLVDNNMFKTYEEIISYMLNKDIDSIENNITEKAIVEYNYNNKHLYRILVKFVEEMAELTKALCKYINNSEFNHNIVEEIIDVSFMISQIKHSLFMDRDIKFELDRHTKMKEWLTKNGLYFKNNEIHEREP